MKIAMAGLILMVLILTIITLNYLRIGDYPFVYTLVVSLVSIATITFIIIGGLRDGNI